jgi:hypothetical protein
MKHLRSYAFDIALVLGLLPALYLLQRALDWLFEVLP